MKHSPTLPFLALALAFAPGSPRAAESYDSCKGFITSLPATITTQGTWCLKQDLATSITSGNAITVATNNVTIDCNDFKLGGLSAGPASGANGIATEGQRLNLTIRNCNIRGFFAGLALEGEGSLVEHNRIEGSLGIGIFIDNAGDARIRRNVVKDTGGGPGIIHAYGMWIQLGSPVIEDNVIDDVNGSEGLTTEVHGIRIYGGLGAVASGNKIRFLSPTGGGLAFGIDALNAFEVVYRDNVLINFFQPPAGSYAFRCSDGFGGLRGNHASGWGGTFIGCSDDGGNVFRNY